MSNLGSVLEEKGDLEGAEAWYLRAARGGNAYAMSNLGLLLAERGNARDATMWYRRAATMGNTGAMHNLGCLLKGVGDLDGAEEWFRYSVDGGNTSSRTSASDCCARTGATSTRPRVVLAGRVRRGDPDRGHHPSP